MTTSCYNPTRFAIVDAFSSGAFYAPALRARGIEVVHVKSPARPPEHLHGPLQGADFVELLDADIGAGELVRRLRDLGVSHVVAGAESGSSFADLLASTMACGTANRPGMHEARQDKRPMHRLLHDAGIPIPWQSHLDQHGAETWSTRGASPGRVVVKPAVSAGSDNVLVCEHDWERERSIRFILTRNNTFGHANTGVVVQELLEGEEFAVNTVSVQGAHQFIEIWKSSKILLDGHLVYDRQTLVSPAEGGCDDIIEYVSKVLDALGVLWGASHTELVRTQHGPRLLETASRPAGGMDPSLGLRLFGRSYIEEVLDAYLVPDWSARRARVRHPALHAMGVSLTCSRSGRLVRDVDASGLRNLASYHGHRLSVRKASVLAPTKDLASKPGGVYLCHASMDQIERDVASIRRWEQREFARCLNLQP